MPSRAGGRVLRRAWTNRGRARSELPEDGVEHLDLRLLRFLALVWRIRHSGREKQRRLFEAAPYELHSVRLANDAATEAFLKSVSRRIREVS